MEVFQVFGTVFGVVGLLVAGIGVFLGVTLVRRMRTRSRVLAGGLLAEAVCLETYMTHSGGHSTPHRSARHVILGFRTEDGQEVRIEDTSRVPRVVGDHVTVRYFPDRPQHAAATDAPPAGTPVAVVIGLAVCAIFTCVGVLLATVGFGVSATAPDLPGPRSFPSDFPAPGSFPSGFPGPRSFPSDFPAPGSFPSGFPGR
ncbi:DUF3592 domain-containing protein [Kitasatospora sp. NPDC051853]|uniref:DUF3592 domain-containing protein n=1 Tax=Kitasatospora sp. NPDC051853 TaxID=3364058 RepID=UPI0037B364CB